MSAFFDEEYLERLWEPGGNRTVYAPVEPLIRQLGDVNIVVRMRSLGYVVLQRAVRLDRPFRAYDRWLRRIPDEFRHSVLGEPNGSLTADSDPYQLASLRNYRSLMPLAQDARNRCST